MSAQLAQALPSVKGRIHLILTRSFLASCPFPSHCVVLCGLMGQWGGGHLMRACEALCDSNHDRGGYTNKLDLLRRTAARVRRATLSTTGPLKS